MSQGGPPTHLGQIPTELALTERQLDPFPWYEEMRESEPVRYDEERDCWDVFRYEDVEWAVNDYETFSNRLTSRNEDEERKGVMTRADPPEHGRLKEPVEEYFTPGFLREFREELEVFVEDIIDSAIAGDDQIEVVTEFSFPITINVIAEILGLPEEDRPKFIEWSRSMLPPAAAERTEEGDQDWAAAKQQIHDYFEEIIEERRHDPGDDLVSKLVQLSESTDRFSEKEVFDTCNVVLGAGHVTTVSLLTSAIWIFSERGLVDDIRNEAIDLDTAIDEVLRYRPPLHTMPRVTRTDIEICGQEIPEGERVVAWLGSANRDEREFDAPDEFRPERKQNTHLSFGKGPHYCIGAPLSRIEADVALTTLFEKVDEIEIATDKREPIIHPTLHGLNYLPIRVGT